MHNIENQHNAGGIEAPAHRSEITSEVPIQSQARNLLDTHSNNTDQLKTDTANLVDKGLLGDVSLVGPGSDTNSDPQVHLASNDVRITKLPPGPRPAPEPIRPIPGIRLPGGGIWRRPLGTGG